MTRREKKKASRVGSISEIRRGREQDRRSPGLEKRRKRAKLQSDLRKRGRTLEETTTFGEHGRI